MTDVTVTREPLTYERTSPHSFFADVAKARALRDEEATARLDRHVVEQRTNPNTDTGTGGEFAPPGYLVDDFKNSLKVGRHFADLVGSIPLPRGISQVNIPRLASASILGGETGVQTDDNQPVTSQDPTTSNVTSPVVTIAGRLDVSQQLYDQTGGPGFDYVAMTELHKDYNSVLNGQLINGTGSNGQLTGLANFSYPSGNSVSGSSATTLTALWPLLGQAAAGVSNARGHRPEFWLMAPRRWFWIAASLDSSNRPIVTPGDNESVMPDMGPSPHVIASVLGVPVYTDGAIAAGTTADPIYCGRTGDMYLFESDERITATVEALAGTLQVRLELRRYAAFVGNLYPSAVGRVTALPAPSNF